MVNIGKDVELSNRRTVWVQSNVGSEMMVNGTAHSFLPWKKPVHGPVPLFLFLPYRSILLSNIYVLFFFAPPRLRVRHSFPRKDGHSSSRHEVQILYNKSPQPVPFCRKVNI